jgi:hypothetical protein
MTNGPKALLAEELRAAMTELPWTWLDYLELEDGVASVVGARSIKFIHLVDGTVRIIDPNTGESLGVFRATVTVEEVEGL